MARRIARGEIWLLDRSAPDKRRSVLVISRNSLLEVLHTATVVAITSTVRGAPTEVTLGVEEGLKETSCANLADIFTVRKNALRRFVGTVGREKMGRICEALWLASGCD